MLKRTFKYVDFNGVEREEDVFFHLSKTDLVELQMSVPGGIAAYIRQISSAQDSKAIFSALREIMLKAYGEKSLDGRRFMKSKEISEAFAQTPMFDELFQELAFDEAKMAAFIDAITPDDNRPRGAITDFTPGPLPTEQAKAVATVSAVE